jgi:tetratricopeptide (TPR) repeat protein
MYGLGKTLLPALMLVGASVAASAQQKACEIDEGSPNQVARAYLDIQTASSAKPAEQPVRLKDAVKLLQDGDMKKNPAGRAMVLGKTYVMWMQQPNMGSGKTTRGIVGFATDTAGSFDLLVGIDSAFSVVETLNPECIAQTTAYRQQKAWVDLVNQANDLANSNQLDSAVVLAKRSLILSKHAPYGYNVIAQAAIKNNKPKEAVEAFKNAIGAAQDSTMADTRRQLLAYLGNYAADQAESSSEGADKALFIAESKSAYEQLAKDPGTKYADNARSGQARLAMLSGDTAAIKGSYSDQLANPGAFSYNSLMLAAVTAAKAQQSKDAIKLFEAARAVNPYHRDVLYNLGRLYLLDSNFTKGIETAQTLVKVDPDNPDNYQLLAVGYGSIKKGYDAKEKDWEAKAKMYGDRANKSKSAPVVKAAIDSASRVNPFIKAYADSSKSAIDSALKFQMAMASLPARVTFTEFTTAADGKTTVGGAVTNPTDAAKSYTIKLEFIDKGGNMVTSQDVPVGPVAPHERTTFKATGTGAGIVAFRYAPLN